MNDIGAELDLLIQKILGPDGSLCQSSGYRFNENQLAYALAMSEHFRLAGTSDKTVIGALQAGTGTGKTIGYLVPMLGYCALTGKKGIVSTYTRALQSQVMIDAAMVMPHITNLTGVSPVVRKRLGKANYLSWSGIHRLEEELDPAQLGVTDALKTLSKMKVWLSARDKSGELKNSGLIGDFIDEQPDRAISHFLSLDLLGLRSSDDELDHEAYRRDADAAKDADVVVVNHATLLVDAISWGGVLDTFNREHDVLVVDEADQLESAAEMINNSDISLYQASRTIKAAEMTMGSRGVGSDFEKLFESAKSLYTNKAIIPIFKQGATAEFVNELVGIQTSISGLGRAALKLMGKKGTSEAEKEIYAEMGEISGLINTAVNTLDAVDGSLAMSWSPIKTFPSLRIGDAEPGRLMGRYWAAISGEGETASPLLKSIVFTSATIGPPGKRVPEAFDDFLNSIGVYRTGDLAKKRYVVCEHLMQMFEPTKFGDMRFVLCDPSLPLPSLRDDEDVIRSPEWIDYTRQMILKAHEAGGRVLVLTMSYDDGLLLSEGLGALGDNLINHARGERLNDCANRLLATNRGVLVTPAGWEGLNLPGALSHVVITRMPFMRPDSTALLLLKLKLSKNLSPQVVEARSARKLLVAAKRKLTQGMGRLIRSETDSGCVWIADPRFPLPDTATQSLNTVIFRATRRHAIKTLSESLPLRFKYEAFEAAKVLSMEGELVSFEE